MSRRAGALRLEWNPLWTFTAILGFWTGVAVLYVLYEVYFYREVGRTVPWGRLIASHLIEWWSWALLTPVVFWFVRRFPLGRRPWWRTALQYLTAAFGALLVNAATIGTAWTLLPWVQKGWLQSWIDQVKRLFAYDILLFFMVALAAHALLYYREVRQREVLAAELQHQLTRAQLDVLTMQLQPHFLFNTLNTIAGLVRPDPGKAEHLITRLGDLLRFSLRPERPVLVPLAEELAFLEGYLEIQRTRFAERLTVTVSVPEAARAVPVPPFLLQPLVENSVRHAVSVSAVPVQVDIRAELTDGRLRIVVEDDGPGLGISGGDLGIGLGNTRARLRQLYGEQVVFELLDRPEGGVQVRIELPRNDGSVDPERVA